MSSSPVTTIEEVLSKSPDTPLTPQEMKLTTRLVCCRLSEDPNGILQMKTGGQVQVHALNDSNSINLHKYISAPNFHESHKATSGLNYSGQGDH